MIKKIMEWICLIKNILDCREKIVESKFSKFSLVIARQKMGKYFIFYD